MKRKEKVRLRIDGGVISSTSETIAHQVPLTKCWRIHWRKSFIFKAKTKNPFNFAETSLRDDAILKNPRHHLCSQSAPASAIFISYREGFFCVCPQNSSSSNSFPSNGSPCDHVRVEHLVFWCGSGS